MSLSELNAQLTKSDIKVTELYQNHNQNSPYQALDGFRQEWNSYRKNAKIRFRGLNRKVLIDRCIFFGFSFFFLTLSGIIFFKTTNWACSLYFTNCQAVKAVTCILCLILSVAAFWTGNTICAKKHAVNDLASKTNKKLARSYRQKQINLSLLDNNPTKKKESELLLKQTYHQVRDRVIESKEEAFRLLDRIIHWPSLEPTSRENLLDQTILELNDKLKEIANSYNQQ